MRLLFFGLPAGVSAIVLGGLVDDGRDVAGVVVPAAAVPHLLADPTLPVVLIAPPAAPALSLGEPTDLVSLAWERGRPARHLSLLSLIRPRQSRPTAKSAKGCEAEVRFDQ